eukprot:TRINITY_DN3628_c0_g1_i1.p1 TRINITY_DN3628_c0_g1~~TRINITY_DN3628_c0_g1_i1.p1  ORF type:complete len:385 (+),score=82.20 TRINITY_DN3628_c0_g1_i1:215-1369(+)
MGRLLPPSRGFIISVPGAISTSLRSLSLKRKFIAVKATAKMTYEKDLEIAINAASLAARLCQSVQRSLLQTDSKDKLDRSPVTVADYGSQALVSFVLAKELPAGSLSLVAEEDAEDLQKPDAKDMLERITTLVNETISTDGKYKIDPLTTGDIIAAIDRGKSEGGPHGRHWVLDPIDGTKGFLRGEQYAIALALLDEGELKLGVLACPNLPWTSLSVDPRPSDDPIGCLFAARKGHGTGMHLLNGILNTKRVCVTTIENCEEASFFESYEAAHSMHDLSAKIAKIMGVRKPPVRIDSQAKYGALARGDGAIYLRFPRPGYREKIWDHAAGTIVIQEAGGLVLDASGNPLDFSKGRFLDVDKGIISTNKKLMPLLLSAIQEALKS